MNLKETNTREKIKKCESFALWFLLAVIIVLSAVYFQYGIFYSAFLIGFTIGIFGFIALSLTFSYIDKLPGWFKIVAIMSTSLKIMFLVLLAFILKKLGFSILQFALGLLTSQFSIILSLIIIIYTSRKSVENYVGKKEIIDART